jgi:regulator of cell morphogenesis and NO signaling
MNNSHLLKSSIASIVNDNFATARIFKYFGIDFCCGGHILLGDACRIAGADTYAVLEALENLKTQEAEAIAFKSWPTDLIIDYVLKIHHRNIRKRGPQLLRDIERVAHSHSDRHPELLKLRDHFAHSLEDLENHLQKEEKILFPYCYNLFEQSERGLQHEKMHCGTVANPIRVMLREHNDEGTRYKYIATLMNDFKAPEDACPSYRLMLQDLEAFMDALFEHIHLENNILFPRFVELEKRCVEE